MRLFSAVGDKYGEAIGEELAHPDQIFVMTGTDTIAKAGRLTKQPVDVFNLVSNYEDHATHQGQALEIHVPTLEVGDKDTPLLWLNEADHGLLLPDGTVWDERWLIIRRFSAHRSHAYRVERTGVTPYLSGGETQEADKHTRSGFVNRLLGMVASYHVIFLKPRHSHD